MNEKFIDIFTTGGKTNSLGRSQEVIDVVLDNHSRIQELYDCLWAENAWVRMRAADSLEKVCRLHPEWLLPYVDDSLSKLTKSNQPSIQWHLAQIYGQVTLSTKQREEAITWLESLLSTTKTDWIVSANAMDTIVTFVKNDNYKAIDAIHLFEIQRGHTSKSVVKRADKAISLLA